MMYSLTSPEAEDAQEHTHCCEGHKMTGKQRISLSRKKDASYLIQVSESQLQIVVKHEDFVFSI